MDAEFWLNGICFKWDRKKATSNLRDHHIAFELACEVFFDPFIRWLSSEMLDREERETVVGLTTGWSLVVVAHVERGEFIRIISARPASAQERKTYEDQ